MKPKNRTITKQRRSNRLTRKRRGHRRSRWRPSVLFERLRLAMLAVAQKALDQFEGSDRNALYYIVLFLPLVLRAIATPRKEPPRRRRISKRVSKRPVRSLARKKFDAKRSGRRTRRH